MVVPPYNQPLQSTTNKGLNDSVAISATQLLNSWRKSRKRRNSEVQSTHTPLQDENIIPLARKMYGHDKVTRINPHFHTNVVEDFECDVINSPLPRCTKATANVDLASVSALEPKGSATTHQTLHAIKKSGHDSMIRTSDVGWVQYSPFFHNNLPSFIMNLPSEMTLFKNLRNSLESLCQR